LVLHGVRLVVGDVDAVGLAELVVGAKPLTCITPQFIAPLLIFLGEAQRRTLSLAAEKGAVINRDPVCAADGPYLAVNSSKLSSWWASE
jgi:hypothetical protein